MKKSLWIGLGVIGMALLVLLDRLSKNWAAAVLKDHDPIVLIKGVFEFQYLENRGMAFGLLQNQLVFFVIVTAAVLAGIVFFFIRIPFTKRFGILRILLIFIAAGAVGNLIDRVTQGYVIDFLYFSLIDFPIFNVADCYVTVSTLLLILLLLFYFKEEEVDEIFRQKRKAKD